MFTAVVFVKNDALLIVSAGNVIELGFQMLLIQAWLSLERLENTWKNMGNDQRPCCLSCIATEPHNYKNYAIPPTWLSHATT